MPYRHVAVGGGGPVRHSAAYRSDGGRNRGGGRHTLLRHQCPQVGESRQAVCVPFVCLFYPSLSSPCAKTIDATHTVYVRMNVSTCMGSCTRACVVGCLTLARVVICGAERYAHSPSRGAKGHGLKWCYRLRRRRWTRR